MEEAAHILVVDDDTRTRELLRRFLAERGYRVATAADAKEAESQLAAIAFDLVVLDVMLPGADGFEVCREIQRDHPVPVLFLTALDQETDLVVGLRLGADDYMTKPFSPRELVARIAAILRRVEGRGAEARDEERPRTLGPIEVHRPSRRVQLDGEPVHLTPTEFDLLWCLLSADGAVLTREQLLHEVWGYRVGGGTRTVDSHVRSLRRKLGDGVIRTVHAVGYAIGEAP